jgi:molecular chaperone GrpE (heat shock protein)
MLKHTVIVGLLLSLAGGALLAWLVLKPQTAVDPVSSSSETPFADVNDGHSIATNTEWASLSMDSNEALDSELTQLRQKSPERQAAEKLARLQADIEKLAAGDTPEPEMGEMLYGPHWQDYVETYRRGQENREIMLTAAVVVMGLGVVTVGICILAGMVRLVVRLIEKGKHKANSRSRIDTAGDNPRTAAAIKDIHPDDHQATTDPFSPRSKIDNKGKTSVRSKVSVDIPEETAPSEVLDIADYHRVYPSSEEAHAEQGLMNSNVSVQNLLSDQLEESLGSDEPILGKKKGSSSKKASSASAGKVGAAGTQTKVQKQEMSKETSTATLEQQIAQVAEMAHEVQTDDTETSEPVNHTLQILNEQISAIRQYASSQQDRVEKLQSGYDWNIIRTFCVRVIRCIDNLEMRMERCQEPELEQTLSEVHDELLFSLESSGVEQFAPELNSSFSGQERLAEAVKAKAPSPKPELKGCIAEIIKPGYQYVIDEQNVKIVRTARVKLYGSDNSPSA